MLELKENDETVTSMTKYSRESYLLDMTDVEKKNVLEFNFVHSVITHALSDCPEEEKCS